jgi:AsmA protein
LPVLRFDCICGKEALTTGQDHRILLFGNTHLVADDTSRQGFRRVRWLLVLVLAVALIIGGALSIPLFVSEQRIGEHLRIELEDATSHRVDFDPAMEIVFFPVPSIKITNVTIHSDSDPEQPLLTAETIEADFGLASVVLGGPEFSDIALQRPVARVVLDENGVSNWHDADHLSATDEELESTSGAEAQPFAFDMSRIGNLEFRDGTLLYDDRRNDRSESVSAINGNLVVNAERPIELLNGTPAPLRLNVSSELLTFNLSGTANLASASPSFVGDLELSSPSVRRALQWSGTELKPGEAISALELEAEIQAAAGQVNLANVLLDIDNNRGIGALSLNWTEGAPPAISGTLAYSALDVGAFLNAFAPLPLDGGQLTPSIDTGFLRQLGLDLRFSAQTARIGRLELQNLAAAARIERGRALFDIGDASAYGGHIMGRIIISENGFDGGGEIQLTAENVDFGAAYQAVGVTGPLPRGRGTLNLTVASPNPVWATTARDLQGRLEMAMGEGSIPGFNLQTFRTLASQERFFSLTRASEGDLPFRSARFATTFANGTAEIDMAEILSGNTTVALSGLIPFDRGSLAMSGAITDAPAQAAEGAEAPAAPPALRFFVGGSWPAPVISPVMGN